MPLTYLGLGSNIGDRHQHLDAAIAAMAGCGRVTRTSRRYETAPVGFLEQSRFLNQVVELDTQLEPSALFEKLKQIEHDVGRKRTFRNGPRVLDIDILLYGDVTLESPRLRIPHPRLTQRAFVLRPLGELIDQVMGTPMVDLLKAVHDQDAVAVAHD